MPHLRFAGLEQDQLQAISKPLVDDLAKLIDCPRDHFTLEHLPVRFVFDGELDANGYPAIDVFWFDRGQVIQDQVARVVTRTVRDELPDKSLDICVRFNAINKHRYYENGEHF